MLPDCQVEHRAIEEGGFPLLNCHLFCLYFLLYCHLFANIYLFVVAELSPICKYSCDIFAELSPI